MYIPAYFKIEDENVMFDVMEKYSFATLFSQHNDQPYATHLPLTIDRENKVMYGHFARPNKQWQDAQNQLILTVFQGPHCYVSPSWYETKETVPTWNYVAVHVYGKMEIIDEPSVIHESFEKMIDKYEKESSSYCLNEVDSGLIAGMMKGIVAFKIHISKMEGKAKLSQNHPVERRQRVIEQLEASLDQEEQRIAQLMKKAMK